MKTPPVITIVIPVWNKKQETCDFFHRAVASIVQHVKTPYRLVIVDNASPCNNLPMDFIRQHVPDWQLVTLSWNTGFARACNMGLTLCDTEWFCQMNSDVTLVEDSVTLMIDAASRYKLDLVMPENYDACIAHKIPKQDRLSGVDWSFGAFFIVKSAVMRSVGGYDDGYEMFYWEDMDLWKQLRAAGANVRGWMGTWVSHVGGASSHPDRDAIFPKNRERYERRWKRWP